MMKPPIRQTSIMYPKGVQDWSKHRDQYLISPKGRWGKNWPGLWWLVFHIAKNLGMVSHHRSVTDSVRICTIDIHGESYAELISNAMMPYLNDGYGPGDLLVLIGSPEFPGLSREIYDYVQMQFGFPPLHKEYAGQRATVYSLPIVVSPHIKGIMVLPRNLFGKSDDRYS